jgi:hypothetical protein
MILVGWLLASVLAPRAGFLERVAYALLFTLAAVPLVAYQAALALPAFLSQGLLAAVSALFLLGLAWPSWKAGRALLPPRPEPWELGVLTLGLGLAGFTWLHHNDAELWLSLGSYLQTDKAKCFYMQTLSFVPELNAGRDPGMVRRAYEIISTPGNSLFTASWMAVLGPWTFKALQSAFHLLLFLFGTLLLQRWTGARVLAVVVSGFAVLNPYTTWIEVLDRNVYVLAASPALLYTVLVHRERALLHGLMLGLIGGLGLRFLPLLFASSIALLYLEQRQPWRRWLLMAAGVVLAFAFELPHLQHHGFHSMGEAQALPGLLTGLRTPLLPYATGVYTLLFALSKLGWILAAVALYGAGCLLRERRALGVALSLMVLLPLVVLAGQRDWIEHDKSRIFVMSLWPVLCFVAWGGKAMLTRQGWGRRTLWLAASLTAVIGLDRGLRQTRAEVDLASLDRKPVYQSESEAYLSLLRSAFAPVGPLPRWLLADKARWAHKRAKAQLVAAAMISDGSNPWIARWFPDALPQAPEPLGPEGDPGWLELSVDLERLVTDPERAVSFGPTEQRRLVDYATPERLFDIHHKEVDVSWQAQPLPVTVLAQRPDIQALREVYLNLNAFSTLERDELGFQKVNLVSHSVLPTLRQAGLATAMTALPWSQREPVVHLRIPADMRVVVRNWVVNTAEGVPHRIDGWIIERDGERPRVRFFYGEPESYL